MHKKRWAALVLAAALVLTGCSFGGLDDGVAFRYEWEVPDLDS